jgi:hypothetical protein
MERVLALFKGSRAPHPAAALAAWKRAAGPSATVGKRWEAAIAAFNPEMVAELRRMDQAELVVTFDAAGDKAHWYATIPGDDGTFASLAPALSLTNGGQEPPLEGNGVAVDRLGPPPSPLAARGAGRFALADTRDGLRLALALPRSPDPASEPVGRGLESGWVLQVNPRALGPSGPLPKRRLAESLRALDCTRMSARAGLEGETLLMAVTLQLETPLPASGTVDPAWLEGLPENRLLAVIAAPIDSDNAAWERRFALADRIERADPAHADVAPLRTRINLLAAGVKVRPEVDLWPHLRGLTAAILVDRAGALDGALVFLHTDSPAAAARIAGQVLPALAPLLGLRVPLHAAVGGTTETRLLGQYRQRPTGVRALGATVRLAWGEPALESIRTDRTSNAMGELLSPEGQRSQRFAAFWPGRLAAPTTVGTPLAATLAAAEPVVWSGRNEPPGVRDVVRWPGLHDLVRRTLDNLPLDLPPGQ